MLRISILGQILIMCATSPAFSQAEVDGPTGGKAGSAFASSTQSDVGGAASRPRMQLANDESAAVHDRLATLRDQAKALFEGGDKGGLAHVDEVLGRIGRNKAFDISCRLAPTGIAREIKGYVKVLDAVDADVKKIAEASVRVAAISVRRELRNCE